MDGEGLESKALPEGVTTGFRGVAWAQMRPNFGKSHQESHHRKRRGRSPYGSGGGYREQYAGRPKMFWFAAMMS